MASKNCIFATKWCFSEKHFANSDFVVSLALPSGVGHFDLVHVGEQRVHPVELG